jgi:dihydroneopterin aldolase
MRDEIQIRGLKVMTRVGVPEEERAQAQELELHLCLVLEAGFGGMGDEVTRTIDYDGVARHLRGWCGEGERCLIETLADEMAAELMESYSLLAAVEVEVRKFILPDCDYVAVRIRREREGTLLGWG